MQSHFGRSLPFLLDGLALSITPLWLAAWFGPTAFMLGLAWPQASSQSQLPPLRHHQRGDRSRPEELAARIVLPLHDPSTEGLHHDQLSAGSRPPQKRQMVPLYCGYSQAHLLKWLGVQYNWINILSDFFSNIGYFKISLMFFIAFWCFPLWCDVTHFVMYLIYLPSLSKTTGCTALKCSE